MGVIFFGPPRVGAFAEVVRTAGQARACVNSGASNDVRAREADYFVGSRAPRTQGQVRRTREEQTQEIESMGASRNRLGTLLNRSFWAPKRDFFDF